jgi:hypothetical protein
MKKIFGVAAVLALLSFGAAAHAAGPCDTGMLIKFDADAFAYEDAYNSATYHSTAGKVLNIVGIVSWLCPPLAASGNPNTALDEYTFYITGLVSAGTGHFGPFGGTTFHETDYAGGTWALYKGSPPDAPTAAGGMPPLPDPTVPANFSNGTVILSGTYSDFHTSISVNGTNINGSHLAHYSASGGTMYAAVGNGSAVFQGNWCPTLKPTGCTPATYSAHPDGKWDSPPTTGVTKSTWGSIKQLYR